LKVSRILLDTMFIQVALSEHDQHHEPAIQLLAEVRAVREAWVTEAVLLELDRLHIVSSYDR